MTHASVPLLHKPNRNPSGDRINNASELVPMLRTSEGVMHAGVEVSIFIHRTAP